MVAKQWDQKKDSLLYNEEVSLILNILKQANFYIDFHPEVRGLFAGQKGKKKVITSQSSGRRAQPRRPMYG